MNLVTQTTKGLEKTPQIHDLCSVLFDPATDHVINNREKRAERNVHCKVGDGILARHKVCVLTTFTNLYGVRIISQTDFFCPLATKISDTDIFIYNAIYKPLSTSCFCGKFSRANGFQIKTITILGALHDRLLGVLTNKKSPFAR